MANPHVLCTWLSVPVFSVFLFQCFKRFVSCILHFCLPSCLFVFLLSLSSCLSICVYLLCFCFPFCLSVDLIACLSSSVFSVNLLVCLSSSCLSAFFLLLSPFLSTVSLFSIPSLRLPFCRSIFLLSLSIPDLFLSPILSVYLSSFLSLLLPFSLSNFRSVYLHPLSISLPSLCLPSFLSIIASKSLCLSLSVCLFHSSLSLSIYLYPSSWLFLVSFLSLFLPLSIFLRVGSECHSPCLCLTLPKPHKDWEERTWDPTPQWMGCFQAAGLRHKPSPHQAVNSLNPSTSLLGTCTER